MKDVELVRKAAKAEHRSMSMFLALAGVEAAKATLAMAKPNIFAPSAQNETKSA